MIADTWYVLLRDNWVLSICRNDLWRHKQHSAQHNSQAHPAGLQQLSVSQTSYIAAVLSEIYLSRADVPYLSKWPDRVCGWVTDNASNYSETIKFLQLKLGVLIQFHVSVMPMYFSSAGVVNKLVKVDIKVSDLTPPPIWEILTMQQMCCSVIFVSIYFLVLAFELFFNFSFALVFIIFRFSFSFC